MSQNEEYEYQFWKFSINDLCIGLRRVILETIQINVSGMHNTIKKKLPEEKRPALSSACQPLLNEYCEKASEHINNLETYIRENFSIPPHILLKEDSVQRQQYTELDQKNLEQEITELSQRINRVHFLEYHLLQELEKNKDLKIASEKVGELTLSDMNALPSSKELRQIMSDCLGLEVEEANCHLKSKDMEECSEFNHPNYCLEVFKKRQKRMPLQNV